MDIKSMRYTLGLASLLLASSALAQSNYALGPVESANSKIDVQILGQRYSIDSGTRCSVRTRVVSRQQCVSALSRDAYAVVETDTLKLDRAAAITVLPFDYVSGASTVMVGARVTSVRPEIGLVSLGSLQVDQTALLSSGQISLEVGSFVEFAGIQPLAGGVVLANGIRFTPSTITGTGAQTITGTGTQTITGTGIQTITGTGIQTITGTGMQTITGTGIQAITGTGAQTITGTGSQTITGTGAQTITGTGAQTITGTGVQTITGTGVQTITGTGAQTITGTGAQTITGTGIQTITGTGIQTITGTGALTITGTGTQTITGTGK
jgi:hypothetical protein